MKCKQAACLFAGWLAFAGGVVAQNGSEVPARLGLARAAAIEAVVDGLASGSPYSEPAFAAFKALDPAGRAAVVKTGLAAIKAFSATGEFQSAYAVYRAERQPEPPEAVPSAEEFLKKQRAEMDTQMAEMRKAMAGLDEATRKSMEETLKQSRAQLEAMAKDPAQKAMFEEMLDQQREQSRLRYEQELSDWDMLLPADPRVLIAGRIREFLEVSADIDFSARLVREGNVMLFENEDYESRPGTWKLCFRAGREAVAAARVFAETWLAELER